MGGHRSLLMSVVWVWVQIWKKCWALIDYKQVKEVDQKLSSNTIMKYPPGIVKESRSWSSVAGYKVSCGGYEHMRDHRRKAIERGMPKLMLLLGSDASTRPREDHLSQGPISIHNSFPFIHKFVLWFGFFARSYSADSTRLWTIAKRANRAKQSKASRAVQMQTRASMAVGTVEVEKRAGVIACKSVLSTAHIALWHANRSLPNFCWIQVGGQTGVRVKQPRSRAGAGDPQIS